MSSTPSISIATAHDAPALAVLRASVARDMTERYGEGDWSATPEEGDVLGQLNASRVLVARRDQQIIGTVRLVRALPWAFDASAFTPIKTALYVLGLAVAPHAREQGVARQLMEAAKEVSRSWPADALWLDAYDHLAGAGPFYLKSGFREVGRTKYRKMRLIYYEWLVRGPEPIRVPGA
ncbi:MAG: GNAT family N-acetyltransferase [Pseudomonadota bacterium]